MAPKVYPTSVIQIEPLEFGLLEEEKQDLADSPERD